MRVFSCPVAGAYPMCARCCKRLRGTLWEELGETLIGGYDGAGPSGRPEPLRGSCLAAMGAREPGLLSRLLTPVGKE